MSNRRGSFSHIHNQNAMEFEPEIFICRSRPPFTGLDLLTNIILKPALMNVYFELLTTGITNVKPFNNSFGTCDLCYEYFHGPPLGIALTACFATWDEIYVNLIIDLMWCSLSIFSIIHNTTNASVELQTNISSSISFTSPTNSKV